MTKGDIGKKQRFKQLMMQSKSTGFHAGGQDIACLQFQKEERCPECHSTNLVWDEHRGEVICRDCGVVVEISNYDYSQEKRAFTADEFENRIHNGAPISALSDISWTTVIKLSNPRTSRQLKRAVRWQTRLTWEKRNLLMAVTDIKRICTNLALPRVVAETAAVIYKKVQKKNMMRGRSIKGFVGACIYAACKMERIPRSITEIYEQLEEVTDRDVRVCYRALLKELGIKVPRVNLVRLIPRYASILGVSPRAEARAECIFSKLASKLHTAGKDPKGFIGAALYIACRQVDERLSQKTIADACSITEVTLRSRIQEFKKLLLGTSILKDCE